MKLFSNSTNPTIDHQRFLLANFQHLEISTEFPMNLDHQYSIQDDFDGRLSPTTKQLKLIYTVDMIQLPNRWKLISAIDLLNLSNDWNLMNFQIY
jgi:hypothetical protein